MFDQREKIALLIDGVNLFAASKALGFNVDFRKLLEAFRKRAYLLRANYYAALVEDQETSSIRPLIAWLDYNGYRVVTKPVRESTDSLGRRKVEGNMDVELAIDAIELAETADHLVIFSGDGNFTSLVAALQRKGRKVSVVSSMSTRPPMISDALRREADHFIDLVKLRAEISRETPERASNGSEIGPQYRHLRREAATGLHHKPRVDKV
ncbi:NYN domain-containing protein [Sinorhizobium meliloti]|uniref:LabA-like NYN domain-containing protein n=1 Tax=Rhizobium meliloti TaxID=382 RepID=UPI001F2E174A|nr:NYN domain-containing protein [Sinorhizobium meliloti]